MAQFTYTAVKKTGERVQGNVDAPNENEVRIILRAQQLRPVKISKPSALEFDLAKLFALGSGIKDVDVILFTRQLSILLSSGIPLVQGLDIISGHVKNPKMKSLILTMKEKIVGGSFLWEALSTYKDVFPHFYISMIRAGEASGAMDTILKRLTKYIEDTYKLKKLAQSAMIYPAVISAVGIAVIVLMLTFVIPKFESMLKSGGQELPGPTQFVIDLSHFMQSYFLFLIGGTAIAVVLVFKYLKTQEGKSFFDNIILKIPLFGGIILKVAIARFARTMQTMLSSGVNLLDAIDICRDSIGNKTLEENIAKIRVEVEAGKTLSQILAKMPIFPSMMTQMITVGESTGNIDKMLERVAEFYEEEVQNLVAGLTKLIEPMVLVVLGGSVGGLMIAMYLPIFKMAGGG